MSGWWRRTADSEGLTVFGPPQSRKGFLCGVCVNVAELLVNFTFYLAIARLPRGAYGRPMAHAALFFLIAVIGLVVGVPLCVSDFSEGVRRRSRSQCVYAVLGTVLMFVALPLAAIVLGLIANLRGFSLED